MTSIAENIQNIRLQITSFEQKYERVNDSVKLLAVSKTHSAEKIRLAWQAGQSTFAENYVQEALQKVSALHDLPLQWHFIGPVQSNKTRDIALHFHWLHSLDRLRIARRLNEQRPKSLGPLKCLIQVNLDNEASKSGVTPDLVPDLAAAVDEMSNLELAGLMAIPAPRADFDTQRRTFYRLAELQASLFNTGLKSCTELSMGMSNDFEAAIAEGSTMVRIGSGIFGPRNYKEHSSEAPQ